VSTDFTPPAGNNNSKDTNNMNTPNNVPLAPAANDPQGALTNSNTVANTKIETIAKPTTSDANVVTIDKNQLMLYGAVGLVLVVALSKR
jgi:hypothetical protein